MNRKLSIMVADDDELILDMVCAALEPLDCTVVRLDDGLMVIDAVMRHRPDLIILDCSMPGLSGTDAVRQIRSSDDCFQTPVLMLTGRRAAADETIARRAGANYYMRKPFDQANLLARVEILLAEAQDRATRDFVPKPTKIIESSSRRSIILS